MPRIRLVSPIKGDLVHFYRPNEEFIDGAYRVIEPDVSVENVQTKIKIDWPLGYPCVVEPSGITTEKRIEVIDEREPEYETG